MFVTFVPDKGDFKCHPLGILEQQSTMLEVAHEFVIVDLGEWELGYRRAIQHLKEVYNVQTFVTGEMDFQLVEQSTYWLQEILDDIDIKLGNTVTPRPVKYMLELLEKYQITTTYHGD